MAVKILQRDEETVSHERNVKLTVHLEEECTNDGTVNFYGQPAVRSKVGAAKTVSTFYAMDFFDTIAWSGASNNLVVYMTTVMHLGNASAANFVSRWTGAAYLVPFVTAIIADSCWGRLWTTIIMLGIFFHGLVLLCFSAGIASLHPEQCENQDFTCPKASAMNWLFFSAALYIFGIGGGAVTPMQAFGGDQFDANDKEESYLKSTFFNSTYKWVALGKVVNVLVVFPAQLYFGWVWGFGISAWACILAMLVLSIGCRTYRYQKPQGSPCKEIAQVVVACILNRNSILPSNFDKEGNDVKRILASQPIYNHPGSRKLIDRVGLDQKPTQTISPCSVWSQSQTADVKCLLYMLPILGTGIMYKTVNLQLSTLFVLQGQYMDRNMWSFVIPSASINIFEHLSVVFWVMFYDSVFVPLVANFTGRPRGITNFQRIGIGFAISIISLVVAAMVESKRLEVAEANGLLHTTRPASMSVFWNIPQYAIFGASEVFVDVGLNEFFYSQSPIQFRTIGTSFVFITTALGSYVSVLLVQIANKLTSQNAHGGWITNNLNQGQLNYFYILLAVLSALNLLCFIYISYFHYNTQNEMSPLSISVMEYPDLAKSPLRCQDASFFAFDTPNHSMLYPGPAKSPLPGTPEQWHWRNSTHSQPLNSPAQMVFIRENPVLRSPYRTFR